MSFWGDKRVCVTGDQGFLGPFVVEKLRDRRCGEVLVARSKDYDLRYLDAIRCVLGDSGADCVIRLAAKVEGIGADPAHPDE